MVATITPWFTVMPHQGPLVGNVFQIVLRGFDYVRPYRILDLRNCVVADGQKMQQIERRNDIVSPS